jgi:hypothetical protein
MVRKKMSGDGGILGGIALSKLFPAAFGIAGAVLVFLFYWPKTPKEGFVRLFSAGVCSHFFGDAAVRAIARLLGEYVVVDEIRTGVYLAVGGIGFFIVGAIVRWFSKRTDKDIQDLFNEVKK